MSDAQSHTVDNGNAGVDAASRLRVLHDMIATDTKPDEKYIRRLSNSLKVKEIAKVLGRSAEKFDISEEAHFNDFLRSLDRAKITAGMYHADLRSQYFNLVKSKMEGDTTPVDQLIAVADWWYDKFSDVLAVYNTGREPERKVLH